MNIMYNKSKMRQGPNGEYYYLQPALDVCTATKRVFAFDMYRSNGSVGKGFVCVNDVEIENMINKNVFGNHFYEILLPDRPTRVFVDIETENGDYERVKKGSETFIEMLKMFDDSQSYILLDSSNSKKCSFHIIGGPYFKNPFHVGALIRKITCYVYSALNCKNNIQNFDLTTLFDRDNNYIVDECIYTMNRQFRLAGMCKLGSDRVLRGCTWKQSILQNVCVDSVSECLEIDNGEPISTSRKTKEMFTLVDGSWTRVSNTLYTKNVTAELPEALRPILDALELIINNSITGVRFNVHNGCYTLSSNCKKCFISNKIHKSNHTWFILNPWQRTVVQKCFDDKCRRSKYDILIDEIHWSKWINISQRQIDISCIENSV